MLLRGPASKPSGLLGVRRPRYLRPQPLNSPGLAFQTMRFLAVAAGFPVTALVIWALIRSPLAARVSAEPRDDRWHERPTPTLGGIAAVFFAIDALTVHSNDAVLALALSLALACAGFLPFNLRRGRSAAVFMGDSGSQVLGFALAALGLTASWKVAGTTVATLLLPILVLAVPILDTTLVTIVQIGRASCRERA